MVNTAVSVKNIKHFEKISFNLSHVSNATTPLLKLTDGVQTSGLDWDKVEVTGANDFVPSTYRTRLATLMHNDQGIDFTKAGVNTYNPIRAKNRESGDLEYTIDTDNPTVTAAKEVYVDGFRFRHNKGTDGKGAKHLALDGTGAAAYGATVTVKDGVAQDNAAEISGGTVTGNAYGGALTAVAATKNAAGGSAHITGGSVGGNVYGGAITDAAASGNVTGSSVHVAGGTVGGTAYGGHNAGTGNTLAIYPGQSAIHDFSGVQKLRFYLPNDARASYTPMLQLGVAAKDIRNLNIGVGFSGSAPVLHGNDVISLMKTLPGGTLLTDADIANQIEGTQGVTMRYQFALQKRGTDELVLTLIGAAMNDQTKSLVEPRCGATDFINRGADLLAASGISSAAKEGGRAEDDEKRGYQLWAAMSQGTMRAETGSYVTTNGYNLSVGWAKEGRLRAAKTLFTPFVEYGRGTYHTYLDDGTHGNGKISYLGAGLMGRIERPDGCWAEAALHGGRVRSSYSGDVSVGTVSTYDSENAYYAAHIGIGKTRLLRTGDTLNTYLRYFYSRQDGVSAQLNTGEIYDFDAVASHRMRVGFTFLHREDTGKEIYAGLAYEYEFDGEGAASYQGLATDSPALRGGSTMVELGYRFIPPDSRLSWHIHMAGWQGTRRGMTGNIQVSWAL